MEQKEELTNWLEAEIKDTCASPEYEKIPALKFEENKPKTITIDFSRPFQKWESEINGRKIKKAIIPCVDHSDNDTKKIFWINTRNPIYRDLLKRGSTQDTFTILKIGSQQNTKYVLINQ